MRTKIVLISSALLALTNVVSAATIGDVLRTQDSDPYLLRDSVSRLVFPDPVTVETWGSPAAQEVAPTSMAQWGLAGALPIREGSKLVKFGTDPQVYAVAPGGRLHWIVSEQVAAALYGQDWNRKIVTLFYSYYPNYRIGAPIESAQYPDGTLFKHSDAPTVYYLINGVARPFLNEAAFKANRFSFASVLTIPKSFPYVKGNTISGFERELNLVSASL
jgi:hypothetical protein